MNTKVCMKKINGSSDELESFAEDYQDGKNKVSAYLYIGSKDRHIIDLLHWIEILEGLKDEIRECDRMLELENQIGSIITKLIHEVGVRMTLLFP